MGEILMTEKRFTINKILDYIVVLSLLEVFIFLQFALLKLIGVI